MSRHPISAHIDGQGAISLASGRMTDDQSVLGGTVSGLYGRLLNAASPQSFVDIWPAPRSRTYEMPHTMVKGHAKTYDLEPVHQ
jgi:hypothetical protein